jgi:L-asparagine oxygenase
MEMALARENTDAIAELAAEVSVAGPGLVDRPEWLESARQASCRLPVQLLKALREFRHDPDPDAVLLLHGFPIRDDDLPATPKVPESVATRATRSASVLALTNLQLGELVAFRVEKAGALIQNVVPVPHREQDQSNVGSVLLQMHVENAFHPHRPDLVALLCLRGDRDRRAALTVASVRNALPWLSAKARKVLATHSFVTEPPPSFGTGTTLAADHAILEGDLDDPDLRVDFFSTKPLDDMAASAMAELAAALQEVTQRVELRAGDMAIVDNRLAVHGRTAFSPYYDGRDRWLQRAFVQLNYRSSRALRPHGGSMLE